MAAAKAKDSKDEIKFEDKQKALDAALSQIEKQFGKGAVMKLGDDSAKMNVEVVPTGSLSLDIALGVGGVPKGRIIEVYGPESSGKTTVALHMVAEVQKRGGIAGYIDAEHAMDPTYAKALGVDIDNLYISQPDDGKQALDLLQGVDSASVAQGHECLCGDVVQQVVVRLPAGPGSADVQDAQLVHALVVEDLYGVHRVSQIPGLIKLLGLHQPALLQQEAGDDAGTAIHAQHLSAKFFSSFMPYRWLFSGWNCTP